MVNNMKVVVLLAFLSIASAKEAKDYSLEQKKCADEYGRLLKIMIIEKLQEIERSGQRYGLNEGSKIFYKVGGVFEDGLRETDFKSISFAEAMNIAHPVVTSDEVISALKKIFDETAFDKGDVTAADVYRALGIPWVD